MINRMNKRFIMAVMMLVISAGAHAQTFETGFFLDDYVYSYKLNPASRPDNTKGFVGLGIGNLCVSANSNLGLNSFLFPVDGGQRLVTGLNEAVSADAFLGGLKDSNKLDADMAINALSFGFAKDDAFYSFELNARLDARMVVPKSVFTLLKSGGDLTGLSLDGLSEDATGFVELVGGYSRSVNDGLRVGGRAKIQVGVANCSIHSLADGYMFPTTVGEEFKISPCGYGLSVDLGVEWRLPSLEKMTLSASVQDLGGMYWKGGSKTSLANDIDIDVEDPDAALESLLELEDGAAPRFVGVGAKFNAGVRYQVVRMLSVGMLASARMGRFSWAEARLGTTFTPGKVFSLAASAGVNSYGPCVGAAASLKVPGFNLYLGTDSIITAFTPEMLPVNKLHTRLTAGLAIAF